MKTTDTRQNQKIHKNFDAAIEVTSNIAIVVVTFLVFYILFRLSIQLQGLISSFARHHCAFHSCHD